MLILTLLLFFRLCFCVSNSQESTIFWIRLSTPMNVTNVSGNGTAPWESKSRVHLILLQQLGDILRSADQERLLLQKSQTSTSWRRLMLLCPPGRPNPVCYHQRRWHQVQDTLDNIRKLPIDQAGKTKIMQQL